MNPSSRPAVTGTFRPCLRVKNRSRVVQAKSDSAGKRALFAQNANGHTRLRRQTSTCFHGDEPWGVSFCFAGVQPAMASGRRGPAGQQKESPVTAAILQ
jgi:hypothetical protein